MKKSLFLIFGLLFFTQTKPMYGEAGHMCRITNNTDIFCIAANTIDYAILAFSIGATACIIYQAIKLTQRFKIILPIA